MTMFAQGWNLVVVERPYGPQSLKYLLSVPLQKRKKCLQTTDVDFFTSYKT